MKRILPLILLLSIHYLSLAQAEKTPNCTIVKKGTFKYLESEDSTAYFTINKTSHIEYHQGGKYQIKSKLKWLSDCQYSMKMLSNTLPDFPFKPGDVMVVTIRKIEGKIIYYTSEVKGQSWDGKLMKID